ncbi:MAG TPA: hypothetical protein PKA91_16920, partial [Leptospiraceae bacterium]|nr:hypothetical protein [Leptospiraceae bacterium]
MSSEGKDGFSLQAVHAFKLKSTKTTAVLKVRFPFFRLRMPADLFHSLQDRTICCLAFQSLRRFEIPDSCRTGRLRAISWIEVVLPGHCIFCNQKKITGVSTDITSEDVRNIIEEYLTTIDKDASIEIAFF